MNRSLVYSLLLSAINNVEASGPGIKYDYIQNGADWPEKWPACGLKNQSPIDLKKLSHPFFSSLVDNFNKIYTNQRGNIEVMWTGDTTKVAVNKEGQAM